MDKRNYPPGQHGQSRRGKLSEYALQLREKQKVMFHYGLREEQLRRFVRQSIAASGGSNWIEQLLSLLERRLDNVVFAWALRGAWRRRGSLCHMGMCC